MDVALTNDSIIYLIFLYLDSKSLIQSSRTNKLWQKGNKCSDPQSNSLISLQQPFEFIVQIFVTEGAGIEMGRVLGRQSC